jgi:hypothetical protein
MTSLDCMKARMGGNREAELAACVRQRTEARMIRQSIISLLLLATMGAAHAQQRAATSDPAKKATADPNERVCKEIATSSRIATRRYCATRAEWQAFEQREQQEIQLMQRPAQGCVTMGGRKC